MTYGYVYVAQCAMGADKNQLVKVLSEAEVHSYQHAADALAIGDQKVSKVAVMEKVHGIREAFPEEDDPEPGQGLL